jgi:hypothetical protein
VNESSCKQEFLDEAAEAAAALDHTPGQSWRRLLSRRIPDLAGGGHGDPRANTRPEIAQRLLPAFPWRTEHTPKIVPYTFDELVKALNQVLPYDWTKFLRDRLDSYGPGAPLGGIINGGWKLTYDEHPSEYTKAMEKPAIRWMPDSPLDLR